MPKSSVLYVNLNLGCFFQKGLGLFQCWNRAPVCGCLEYLVALSAWLPVTKWVMVSRQWLSSPWCSVLYLILVSAFQHLEGVMVRAALDEIAHWAKREAGQQPCQGGARKESRRVRQLGQQCRREGVTVTPQAASLSSLQFLWGQQCPNGSGNWLRWRPVMAVTHKLSNFQP